MIHGVFLCKCENLQGRPVGGKEALADSGEQGEAFAGKFHPGVEYYI